MYAINPRNLILKQLLFELNQQFLQNTLDINTSLRNATQSVLDNQKQLNLDISQVQENNIREQLTLFMFAFTKGPTIWAQMLKNDEISTDSTTIVINKPQTLTKVYKQIIKQTNILIHQSKAKVKGLVTNDEQTQQNAEKIEPYDFQKQYVTSQTKSMLANLLNNLAIQICTFYKQGKKSILKQISAIEEKIKDSVIMNAYFLFGMLKQMSSYTYVKIQEEMSEYFKNLPASTIRNFCRYVQKNYQLVELTCSEQIAKIFTEQEQKQFINQENDFWLNFLKSFSDDELTLKKVKSTQGETGFMLIKNKIKQKNEDDTENFQEAENLILKVNSDSKIMVTNSKASQKKWEIVNIKDSVSGLYKILKREIIIQTGGKIEQQVIAYGIPLGQYANLGGNIGRCLADINKYKNANSFLKDLSTSTVIGGSMALVLRQIPILNYFVIAGGLSYTFYHTFNNKVTSKSKKFKQLGKTSITAVGSVGSAVAGMAMGQTFIPVPFLGAFVGGVIGGFLGQTGANLINNLMTKQSYKNLIKYLKQQVKDGYWRYTPQLLQKLGISNNYFKQSLGQNQYKKNAYVTAFCFCVVCFHEAKRYIKRNEQKMKELQKKKQHKQEIQLLNQEQAFETQFDIVGIIDYLTDQKIILIKEHDKLEQFIKHLKI